MTRRRTRVREDAPGDGDVTPDPQPSSATSLTGSGPGRYGREVARIGAEAAEALAYAHRRGVQHRDIKPSNILLDARGTAWITDFGLAKIEGDDGLTETGDVVGTLRYIAPERFEGHSDARCDIYALGVTLYEMLALRPAFEGGNGRGDPPDPPGAPRPAPEDRPADLARPGDGRAQGHGRGSRPTATARPRSWPPSSDASSPISPSSPDALRSSSNTGGGARGTGWPPP